MRQLFPSALLFVMTAALVAAGVEAQAPKMGGGGASARTGKARAEPAQAAMPPETVLADNGIVKVTKADYDLELTKLPPNMRGGFATNEKRVVDLINRLLVTKTLSAQADARGIPKEPEVAKRIESEFEKVKAQIMTLRLEAEAAARFDANPRPWELRARDVYSLDPKKYETSDQVSVSHILFKFGTRPPEEVRKSAEEARARVLAGTDFNTLAREISEDQSAKDNSGRLGFFGPKQMDPGFEKAAFEMTTVGSISEVVETAYGYHVLKLDGRTPGKRLSFEEAKPGIMQELRQQYIASERDRQIEEIRTKGYQSTNMDAVAAMVIRVDYDAIDKAHRDILQRQREKEAAAKAK